MAWSIECNRMGGIVEYSNWRKDKIQSIINFVTLSCNRETNALKFALFYGIVYCLKIEITHSVVNDNYMLISTWTIHIRQSWFYHLYIFFSLHKFFLAIIYLWLDWTNNGTKHTVYDWIKLVCYGSCLFFSPKALLK